MAKKRELHGRDKSIRIKGVGEQRVSGSIAQQIQAEITKEPDHRPVDSGIKDTEGV